MPESFRAEEEAAARALDAAIDALSSEAGAAVDQPTVEVLRFLSDTRGGDPPATLRARVERRLESRRQRRWLPARLACFVLGSLFIGQGLGGLFFGHSVAEGLGVAYDWHAFFESGVLSLALGGIVLAGAVARRWLDVSTLAGAPVGIAFAINGAGELSEFPAGGVLHVTQGVAALALAILWWHGRRYVSPLPANKRYER